MARDPLIDIVSELVANVLAVSVTPGARVAAGEEVALLESMKMEIPVIVESGGVVEAVKVAPGDVVQDGDVLITVRPSS
ncbi:biotin/lipoyl-binding carrier protein [Nocardioides sp. R-C-SC26]|uniref:biotin/lipoyl-binding carrier protein n=1 Tax=Nocardioides sp. R-C-SC26 TaxID=2870414 RepID=UPI001E4FB98A|nr:biotin/lipoyl-binding carrier protein [Nocardioides sp. R-C-SC26]